MEGSFSVDVFVFKVTFVLSALDKEEIKSTMFSLHSNLLSIMLYILLNCTSLRGNMIRVVFGHLSLTTRPFGRKGGRAKKTRPTKSLHIPEANYF